MSFILYLFLFIKLLSKSCNTLYNPFFVFLFPLYWISCPLGLVKYSVRILTEYYCTTTIVFCNLDCILKIIKTRYTHLYCISFLLFCISFLLFCVSCPLGLVVARLPDGSWTAPSAIAVTGERPGTWEIKIEQKRRRDERREV